MSCGQPPQRGSYVSLQSALALHGIIPEHVPVETSGDPGRPETVHNPLGAFQFNQLSGRLLFGYSRTKIAAGQFAFVTSPGKALLDLIHLTPASDSRDYLNELRLQNPAALDVARSGWVTDRGNEARYETAGGHPRIGAQQDPERPKRLT